MIKIKIEKEFSIPEGRMKRHRSDAYIISCIDPRFSSSIWEFVSEKHLNNFDSFLSVPGGAKVLARDTEKREEVKKDILKAIELHNISNIYLFVHTECGEYSISDLEKERNAQIEDLLAARDFLLSFAPDVLIFCFLADGTEKENKVIIKSVDF